MFDFDELLRGYTDRQYAEALVNTIVLLLVNKEIITAEEYVEFRKKNFSDILNEIIKRDKGELEEWKKRKLENQ